MRGRAVGDGCRRASQAAIGADTEAGHKLLSVSNPPSCSFDPVGNVDQSQEKFGSVIQLQSLERLHVGPGVLGNDWDMDIVDAPRHAPKDCVCDVDERAVVLTCARVVMPDRADMKAKLDLFRDRIGEPRNRLGHLFKSPMKNVMQRLIEILRPPKVLLVLRFHGDVELDREIFVRNGPRHFLDLEP